MSQENEQNTPEAPVSDDVPTELSNEDVAQFVAQLEGSSPEDTPEEQPQESPQETGPPQGQEVEQEATPEKPKSEQLLEMARRERELRQRESEIEKQVEERVKAQIEQLNGTAKRSVVEHLRKLGYEDPQALKQAADEIYYDLLGDDAPAEYKARRVGSEVERLRSEMEQKLKEQQEAFERREQERAAQESIRSYQSNLDSYLKAEPSGCPLLTQFYKDDPQETLEVMLEAANTMVNDGYEGVPSAQQVAESLEFALEKQKQRWTSFGQPAEQQTQASPQSVTKAPPKSLSSKNNISSSGPPSFESDDEEHQYLLKQAEEMLRANR